MSWARTPRATALPPAVPPPQFCSLDPLCPSCVDGGGCAAALPDRSLLPHPHGDPLQEGPPCTPEIQSHPKGPGVISTSLWGNGAAKTSLCHARALEVTSRQGSPCPAIPTHPRDQLGGTGSPRAPMGAWGCSPPLQPQHPAHPNQWLEVNGTDTSTRAAPWELPNLCPRSCHSNGVPREGGKRVPSPHTIPGGCSAPPERAGAVSTPCSGQNFPHIPRAGAVMGHGEGGGRAELCPAPFSPGHQLLGGLLKHSRGCAPSSPRALGLPRSPPPPPDTQTSQGSLGKLPGAQLKGWPSRVPLTPHSCSTSSIKGETGGVKELPPAPGPPRIPLPWAPAPGGPSRASTTKRSSAQLPSRAMAPPRRGQLPRLYNPGPPPGRRDPRSSAARGWRGGRRRRCARLPVGLEGGGPQAAPRRVQVPPGPRRAGIPKIRCGARSRAPLVRGRGGKR